MNWGKASILIHLKKKCPGVRIPKFSLVNREEYLKNPEMILEKMGKLFAHSKVAIRSNSASEDTEKGSLAGHFHTELGVPIENQMMVHKAIKKVFRSYEKVMIGDSVIVQEMVSSVIASGVLFTRDMETYSPYFIVNYDDVSGKTDTVTSGNVSKLKSVIVFRGKKAGRLQSNQPIWIEKLIEAAIKIENCLGHDALDIEFGILNDFKPVIFQARPLATRIPEFPLSESELEMGLRKAAKKISKMGKPHPGILGRRSIFGMMPDWNPAEMIGLRPRKLAMSLYQELITDATWAYQRNNYGYRNLRSFPLMVSILGVPFIDVRASFNSFIPKSLDENISKKLVDYYLDKLEMHPSFHDKVEFEIVFSCFYLGMSSKSKILLKHGFNDNELKRLEYSLLQLTNGIISPEKGVLKQEFIKIEKLQSCHSEIVLSDLSDLNKVYWLTENCKRYGTLPFAGIARCAFISIQFLRSFLEEGFISRDEMKSFMSSLNTISKKMTHAITEVKLGKRSKEQFLKEYGHLRPGTYDITSPRYDEAFDRYFANTPTELEKNIPFSLNSIAEKKLNSRLKEEGILCNAESLLQFMREAIEGREWAKHVFTRSVSEILRHIGKMGKRHRLSDDVLSHLNIKRILDLYMNLDTMDLKEFFISESKNNSNMWKLTSQVRMPPLISNPGDLYSFSLSEGEPNYITQKKIEGSVLPESKLMVLNPYRKVICIRSADPGYDWIFSKKPSGIITQFGGANSHMAIRCAELGIPAVIGAGEINYGMWSRATRICIDGLNQRTTVLS